MCYKHPVAFDFSRDHLNTLSSQSQKVIRFLPPSMKVTLFVRPDERPLWAPLLELYRQINPQFSWNIVDPDLRPDLVKSKNLNAKSGMLFEDGEKFALAKGPSESDITTAILKISRPHIPSIGFLQGHGERDPFGVGQESLAGLKSKLEDAAFEVKTVELASTGKFPQGLQTLVVWGPTSSLLPEEIQAIDGFIFKGGHLIVALDPVLAGPDPHPVLRLWLEKYGIHVYNDLVLDQIGHVAGAQASVPIIKHFDKSHPVTRDMASQVYFPLTASVEKVAGDFNVTVLAETSSFPAAWADRGLSEMQSGKLSFNANVDKKGPIGVMAVSQVGKSKVAVFGNSTFLTDQYLAYGGNGTLFLNLVEWILGEEKFIADSNTSTTMAPLLLGETELGILFYFSVVFLPLIMFVFAIYRYRRSVVG